MPSCCLYASQSFINPYYVEFTVGGGRGGTWEPPQGQGWNALAGGGHQAQRIWRLKVTSSPCRHPSAHVLECVSSPKYSVCRGPVNAWLFLASARWRTRLAGSAVTHTHTLISASMSCTYISLFSCRRLASAVELKLSSSRSAPLPRLKMWKISVMISYYHGSIWEIYCGN